MRPLRLPVLLRKSLHANLLILATKQPMKHPPLELHAIPQTQLLTLVHNFLASLDGDLTEPGNLLRCRHRSINARIGAFKHPRREPPLARLGPAERLARQDNLHCATLANRVREALRAAPARDDTQRDLGLSEFRTGAAVEYVGHHGEFAAAAQGVAVHCGDEGFAQSGDGGGPEGDEVVFVGVGEGEGRHFFDVGAGF